MRRFTALALITTFAVCRVPGAFTASEVWRPLGAAAAVISDETHWEHHSLVGLVVDPDGNPILTTREYFPDTDRGGCRVRRWDGSSWREEETTVDHRWPGGNQSSVLLSSAGELWATWCNSYEFRGFSQIMAAVRVDGAWRSAGRHSSFAGGISRTSGWSSDPVMALGADGYPIVAWLDSSSGERQIFIRRFDGTEWREMGYHSAQREGVSDFHEYMLGAPALAVGPDGTVHLAWTEFDTVWLTPLFGYTRARVRSHVWNGSEWTDEGPDVASGGEGWLSDINSQPSMDVLDDGSPVIVWCQGYYGGYALTARRFDGVAWQSMGERFPDANRFPRLMRGDGVHPLIVAGTWDYVEYRVYGVHVRRWNGSAWAELGAGSATGAGLSTGLRGTTLTPQAACDASGRPVVAWESPEGAVYVLSAGPGLPHIGDANGDWEISVADVVTISNHLAGTATILDAQAFDRADVTRDGLITSADLDALLDVLLGE